MIKQNNEELKNLRLQKDKLEGQLRLLSEELNVVQKSFDELSFKKQSELDLLTKELNTSVVKDRDLK